MNSEADQRIELGHIRPNYDAKFRNSLFLCSRHGMMPVRKADAEKIRLVCGCVRPNQPRKRYLSYGRA
jgi:hypothetical protein